MSKTVPQRDIRLQFPKAGTQPSRQATLILEDDMAEALRRSFPVVLMAALACAEESPQSDPRVEGFAPQRALVERPPAGQVASQPCGDGVCDEAERGDPSLCPRDCEERSSAREDWCGDGICDALEEASSSCDQDCAAAAAAKAAAVEERTARAAADPDVISSGLAPAPGKVVNPPPPALSPPLDRSSGTEPAGASPAPTPAPAEPAESE